MNQDDRNIQDVRPGIAVPRPGAVAAFERSRNAALPAIRFAAHRAVSSASAPGVMKQKTLRYACALSSPAAAKTTAEKRQQERRNLFSAGLYSSKSEQPPPNQPLTAIQDYSYSFCMAVIL
jgi:hypothetical protein